VTPCCLLDVIDIYLERATSIFRVEEYAEQARRVMRSGCFFSFSAYFSALKLEVVIPSKRLKVMLAWFTGRDKFFACLAYYSSLKLEAVRSSETSVKFSRTKSRHVPEDSSQR
jgi:hypothetical protein